MTEHLWLHFTRHGPDTTPPIIARGEGVSLDQNEAQEFSNFSQAIAAIEHNHDVVVIDTPGNDTYLMRLAHSMADTLITPLNDSFVDFDVLGTVDPATFAVTGTSHFSEMVREARRQRRIIDHGVITGGDLHLRFRRGGHGAGDRIGRRGGRGATSARWLSAIRG